MREGILPNETIWKLRLRYNPMVEEEEEEKK